MSRADGDLAPGSSPARHTSRLAWEETEYPTRFYAEMAPAHLRYICAWQGGVAAAPKRDFAYCELGCGTGLTACVLAASNPHAHFTAVDRSGLHVARAAERARRCGIDNLEVLQARFGELESVRLPAFDFIAVHGVYTWVNARTQTEIRRFIDRHLRPGGLLYLSYNALPGWSSVLPLRRFFEERAARLSGPPTERARAVRAELEELWRHRAPLFADNPVAARVFEDLRTADSGYLVHEYLVPGWAPRYFSDVHRELECLGLVYVGDARVLENLLEYSTPPAFLGPLRAVTPRSEREARRDFVVNRFFRRDIYRRAGGSPRARTAALATMPFALARAPGRLPAAVTIWGGRRPLRGGWFENILEAVAAGRHMVREMAADLRLRGCPPEALVEHLALLVAAGAIVPCSTRPAALPRESLRALAAGPVQLTSAANGVLLARAEVGEGAALLASPVTGSGIVLAREEGTLLRSLARPGPATVSEAAPDDRGGRRASAPCGVHAGSSKAEESARCALDAFVRETLPILAALGIVKPAASVLLAPP